MGEDENCCPESTVMDDRNFRSISDANNYSLSEDSKMTFKTDHRILKRRRKKATHDERNEAELEIMSKIDHPHLIRLHGATYDDIFSNKNIFFEWMAGGSVSQLLQKHGPFTEHVTSNYALQTLLGLEYLHKNGILHRDLKGEVPCIQLFP